MVKLDITEDERTEIHDLRSFLDEVAADIRGHGLTVGGGFNEKKQFLDALILKIDRAESAGAKRG